MNRELQTTRNDNVRKYIDIMDGTYRNHIRFNVHNSIEHEMTKAEICYSLLKANKEFLTECRLKNLKNIIDVFVTDSATAIEILHTETEKLFKQKIKKYPEGLKIIKVSAKNYNINDISEVF